ncbi:MAG: DUF4432 family protein [Clostridia bacterium]|nr:DUF4432 family protein [Clostridia bacterium]
MNSKISNFDQICSLRRYTLTEGEGGGLDVIDCDNGKLRFLLNVSCALDMMQLYCEGTNLSFISKNGFNACKGPFSRRFEGGMLYTCGLDSVGDRRGFEVHGSLHQTPARVTAMRSDEDGITVEAEVRSSALFGEHLVLKRRFFTPVMGDFVTLKDTLVNAGHTSADYCLLYHVNVGYPLLDEGAKLEINGDCTPRTPWAAENVSLVREVIAPEPGREETCYFWQLHEPRVTVINEGLGRSLTLSYTGDTLPHFIEWQSMASGDYALGLEPATTVLDSGFAYKQLAPAAKVCFGLCWKAK